VNTFFVLIILLLTEKVLLRVALNLCGISSLDVVSDLFPGAAFVFFEARKEEVVFCFAPPMFVLLFLGGA